MKAVEFITEKTIINPDVNWVGPILKSVDWESAYGDVYELADLLTNAFEQYDIAFEPADRADTKYGSGVFTGRLAKSVGIPGAEFIGGDPLIIVYITKKTASFPEVNADIIMKISQLIKHELIHVEQNKMSGGKVGRLDANDDVKYYSDPQEIAAIASEMVTELLKIEPDKNKLLDMLKTGNKNLQKSDRYRLYINSARQDPKFLPAYKRIIRSVVDRLQARDNI